jgi:Nuclear pore complex assembly
VHLPKNYWTVIQGFWFMDHLNFKPAIECLCQPALKPTFPGAVLQALFLAEQWVLAWAYLRHYGGAGVDLGKEDKLEDGIFQMLCIAGVEEAFSWLREQERSMAAERRRKLFEKMIGWALEGPKTPAEFRSRSKPVELINLPFNEEENEWFEDFLLKGEGKVIDYAADTVMLRRVAMGRVKEALELNREMGGELAPTKFHGLGWDGIAAGLEKGSTKRLG